MVINSLLRVAYFKIAQTSLVFGVLINSNPEGRKAKRFPQESFLYVSLKGQKRKLNEKQVCSQVICLQPWRKSIVSHFWKGKIVFLMKKKAQREGLIVLFYCLILKLTFCIYFISFHLKMHLLWGLIWKMVQCELTFNTAYVKKLARQLHFSFVRPCSISIIKFICKTLAI